MKNIEALVTDLETSKQLQEAGIKYDTAFVWAKYSTDYTTLKSELILRDDLKRFIKELALNNHTVIPAFTAGELMQVLPEKIDDAEFVMYSNFCGYKYPKYDMPKIAFNWLYEKDMKPVEALAKLCLWCKKEGYL